METVLVKIEPVWEPEEAASASNKEANESLYTDHQVKKEVVLSPKVPQPPDVAYALQGQHHVKQERQFQTNLHIIKEEPREIKKEPKEIKEELEEINEESSKIENSRGKTDKVQKSANTWYEIEIDTKTEYGKTCSDKHLSTKETTTNSAKNADSTVKKRIQEKVFKCNHCSYAGATNRELINHKRIHTGQKVYKCDQCNYLSTSKRGLTVHDRKHSGDRPFTCTHCSYATSKKWALLVHEKKHSGEKSYKCQHCSYACAKKGDLTHHERIHTGVKPYRCDQCSHSTAHKDALQVHRRKMHTGDNPYKCGHCSYSSAKKNHLTAHVKIHADEKT